MPDWSKEDVVINHWLSDPSYLHPANSTFQNARMILQLTQAYLLGIDQMHKGLVPLLAKSLPEVSPDQLQFTYEILSEATWDDGSPVTADDVIFTFKANKCPLTDNPMQKPPLENLKTIIPDPSNPKRFTIVMKRKYIQAISLMTDYPILSRKFFDPKNMLASFSIEQMDDKNLNADANADLRAWATEFNDGKYGNDPAFFYGAGPYKVVSWDRGTTVILEKKQNHWTAHLEKQNVYLNSFPSRIIFKVIKDENAVMLECKAQTIDCSIWLSTKKLLELQRDSSFNRNYNAGFMENYGMNYIALNMRPDGVKHKKIFDDVKVRHAMALLTPVDRMIEVLALGKATRWPSMVSPLKPEYNDALKPLAYNVAEASNMLDEAGWKDTDGDNIRDKMIDGEKVNLEVELSYSAQNGSAKDVTNMVAEAAYPAGVKIIPKPLELSVLMDGAHNHDFDMLLSAWSGNSLPQDFSQVWSSEAWASKGSNFSGFGNAASDALIDSINVTLNDSVRIPLVMQLQKLIYDEQPYVFLFSTYRKTIIHKRLGNAIMTAELPGLIVNNLKPLGATSLAMVSDVQ